MKREFTNEHRKNYMIQNKSSIFDFDTNSNTTLTTIKKKYFPEFVPKFKDQYMTANQRKLTQSWKKHNYIEEYSKSGNTFGFFNREIIGYNKHRINTSRESTLNNKKLKANDFHLIEKRSQSVSLREEDNNVTKSARMRKIEGLSSNIFNDPVLNQFNILGKKGKFIL